MISAENKLYTMKAGQLRSSSASASFLMIEVIIVAAWKAMFRDGYELSSVYVPLVFEAGGICARCSKQSVV